MDGDTPTAALAQAIRRYLINTLPTDKFVAWVAHVNDNIAGTSGVVMFERPPVYGNLSGLEAYIMNIYTIPNWRGRGVATADLAGLEAYIMNIYTVPYWRGQGVATALLGEIISYVKITDARRIWLHATEEGKRLYKKFGFVSTTEEMELVW